VGSAPVGYDGTEAWLEAIGQMANVSRDKIDGAKNKFLPAIKGALSAKPINGRITMSGYEGSELLVARLLVESGADVRYVGTACPRTPYSEVDREWLAARGIHVQYRASLEQDLAAIHEFTPDLAIGTTPVVRKPRGRSGAVLHQPDFGAPADGPGRCRVTGCGGQRGPGQQGALETMTTSLKASAPRDGVWEDVPQDHPEFRDHYSGIRQAGCCPQGRGDD
jgi:chlorophyllide a reductase subunit Y